MQYLLILLLVATLCGQKYCKITEEACKETTEYTSTSLVQQTYELIVKLLGFNVKSAESENADCENWEENKIYKMYTENGNDKEGFVDRFTNHAQITVSKIFEDSTNVDSVVVADKFKEVLGINSNEIIEKDDFEYHPMKRIDPVMVGQIKRIQLPDGRIITMKTLSKQPPLFEIEHFLTDKECDTIIEVMRKEEMVRSRVFTDLKAAENANRTSMNRNSASAFLKPPKIGGEFLDTIHARISEITEIPVYVIKGSEPINIVKYNPGGYYHAHHDSTTNHDDTKPCCFQSACKGEDGKDFEGSDCCNLCRYASFLYYLNDVEGGGETAFPLADMTMSTFLKRRNEFPGWTNLTKHCHDSNVVVRASKGKAIFWYNHYLDPRGYLGGADWRSHHGGCHVTTGTKWIATNWISIPTYSDRRIPGRHENITKSYETFIKKET